MNKHIHFYGLARSGHHAIIYWLAKCARKHKVHYANSIYLDKNPLDPRYSNLGGISKNKVNVIKMGTREEDIDYLFTSSEDFPAGDWGRVHTFENVSRTNFAILRDPFNNLASRMKLLEKNGKKFGLDPVKMINGFPDLWLSYFEMLGSGVELINYNYWFQFNKYRKHFIEGFKDRLDLEYTDDDLNHIPAHGEGSSFENKNRGQSLGVLDRWQKYKDDALFWACLCEAGPRLYRSVKAFYKNCHAIKEPIEMLGDKLGLNKRRKKK